MKSPRDAYRWRILCHSRGKGAGAWSRGNHKTERHHDQTDPDATEFDELVVGHWLHIEEMDNRVWWMNIGGVVLWVTVRPDGQPKTVAVDLEMPIKGCTYHGAVAS